ncbi:alpha/beta fold hydrolase [Phytoactinopolyspora limicola]|uniref:alpha/beta fold hydrolase n=1 Tax=Phytoactinopolyspora limicola TaxID=2715536 RepID=UPI0014084988|nr:alpha/beta fold hydrolase [Phytoactinopolyspora limicola]
MSVRQPGARLLAAAVAAALAGSITAPAATANPTSPVAPATQVQASVPELTWGPCEDVPDETDEPDGTHPPDQMDQPTGTHPPDQANRFRCATAEVPTSYAEPIGAATTTIALIKLPAADPDARIGTLFTNPGGPGDSGVDFVRRFADTAFTDDVRARFDIVGFDPRGVGASDPATCYRTEEDEHAALANLPHFPGNLAEQRLYIRETARLAAHCRIMSRSRIEHASTANVARDMDLLRQAVGDDQLTYIGYSYGSYLGATYAKLFPTRVRALAVDGVIVPDDYAGRPGTEDRSTAERMGQGPAASETFGEFLRLCAEAGPRRCDLAGLGDPAAVVDDLLERLAATPIDVDLPDGGAARLTYAAVVAHTYMALYDPRGWPTLASFLAQLAAEQPKLSGSAAELLTRSGTPGPQRRLRGQDYPSVGGSLASACVDTGSTGQPNGFAERADLADQQAPHFGRYRVWLALPCEYLRLTDADTYLGPWDQHVPTPVLVVGTRFDPATPYSGTPAYAAHFPDARVLTVDGWGHTTVGKSTCATDVIGEYLVDPATAADGTTCPQDTMPFSHVTTDGDDVNVDGWQPGESDGGWTNSRG